MAADGLRGWQWEGVARTGTRHAADETYVCANKHGPYEGRIDAGQWGSIFELSNEGNP
jgi:hypothetical protein